MKFFFNLLAIAGNQRFLKAFSTDVCYQKNASVLAFPLLGDVSIDLLIFSNVFVNVIPDVY